MGFYLIYSGHKYNCGLKIANQWDKRHNVTFTWKKVKFGSILERRQMQQPIHASSFQETKTKN